ncbi:MAG: nucleotidyltransferase [Aureliella sp.]
MLLALNGAGVEYLLVGAYALAAHGSPRATGDIDFWIRADAENAKRVWSALVTFGAPTSQITIDDFSTPGIVFQIGLPPQRIDILTSISGVDFPDAWDSRLEVEIEGMSVPVLSLKDLLVNKSSSGRDKDKADIPTIERLLG